MKFPRAYSLAEIEEFLGCESTGNPDHEILGINEIHVVDVGDLVFVDHPKYYDKALQSAATTVLINKKVEVPAGKAILISDDPFRDFNRLTEKFRPFESANSAIADDLKIGENSIIQPNCFVGKNVKIGRNCLIHSNVSIYDNCEIGDNVIIHANTVIGSHAFYYKKRETGYDRLKSGGRVVIENEVEIGANCTIDKGVSGVTRIGEGTKIDNLCQIGHDTKIGKNCLFAAQVGIAGCTIIEDNVTMWGQVGVTSGITIGAGAVVYAQSGVSKSLAGGQNYFGSPAEEAKKKYREVQGLRRLLGQ